MELTVVLKSSTSPCKSREAFKNVKRKVPAARKAPTSAGGGGSSSLASPGSPRPLEAHRTERHVEDSSDGLMWQVAEISKLPLYLLLSLLQSLAQRP